jgi:ligand-binding sensor domain-containing protein
MARVGFHSFRLLKKYNPAANSFTEYDVFQHSPKTVSTWIEKLHGISTGSILIGTSNQGVKIFDPKQLVIKIYSLIMQIKQKFSPEISCRSVKRNAGIATESGIFVYNLKTGAALNLHKDYNNPYSISDNAVYTFCKDKEGGIWSGTYFGGINYYPRQSLSFQKYFPDEEKNSLSGNVVRVKT